MSTVPSGSGRYGDASVEYHSIIDECIARSVFAALAHNLTERTLGTGAPHGLELDNTGVYHA